MAVEPVSLAELQAGKPPSSRSDRRERVGRGFTRRLWLLSLYAIALLLRRSNSVVRHSRHCVRCSNATRSVHRSRQSSVHPVGVGHSKPPVKGSRLRSLEPSSEPSVLMGRTRASLLWTLWNRFLQVPTLKQEPPTSASEGRVGPNAVGGSSSPRTYSHAISQCVSSSGETHNNL